MEGNFKQKFEDRTYKYALAVVLFANKLKASGYAWSLVDQLLRSGTSVTANIFEAKSASSKKDYINFYNHALKSANESKLWLRLINDSSKSDEIKTESADILRETEELSRILGSSILTMRSKTKI